MSKVSPIRQELMNQAQGRAASQATTVEQSRAIAEVQAAVVVAQQCPRSETQALSAAMETCGMVEVAERAFFKFPRGGQTVSGPSIHLAVELARVWGNVKYGLRELSRDDAAARSEMLAYAWDVQTNTRAETTFIVPHMRDKKGGPEVLTDLRDVYENNANAGSRRLREMIFRVLPPYLVERAKAKCLDTLQKGGGKPLPARRLDTLAAFEKLGISRARMEAKLGKADGWTEIDIANLGVSYQSIKRGEITAAEEFPEINAESISAELKQRSPQAPAAQQEEEKSDEAAGADPGEAVEAQDADPDGWQAWLGIREQEAGGYTTPEQIAEMEAHFKAVLDDEKAPTDVRQRFASIIVTAKQRVSGGRKR